MLAETLRARGPWGTPADGEPSRWLIVGVAAAVGLIFALLLLGALLVYSPHRWWVLAALVLACLAPYFIGMQIVRSTRKQNQKIIESARRQK